MRRVMIVGQPGAGKSTLALRLGARLGLPVVHMDHIHWTPGWIERDRAERTALVRKAIAADAWVFEGGHSVTWDERLARADTLIWLDMSVTGRLWRCTRRAWRYRGQVRPDMQDGCPDGFGQNFWEFAQYIVATRHSGRARIEHLWAAAPSGKSRVRLTRFAEADRWLENIG